MKDLEPSDASDQGSNGNGATDYSASVALAPFPVGAPPDRATQAGAVARELRNLSGDPCLSTRRPQLESLATALDDVDEAYAWSQVDLFAAFPTRRC